MKIYTRTGDAGTTSLVGGTRVSKASARLEAYGTVDELNSHIGLLLAQGGQASSLHSGTMGTLSSEAVEVLSQVQHRLFNLGSSLATEPDSKWKPQGITPDDVAALEDAIDRIDSTLPRHNRFILPGGTVAAAQANVARTVARRAERRMVQMAEQGIEVAPDDLKYINRLSDLLFVIGRQANILAAHPEVFWEKD